MDGVSEQLDDLWSIGRGLRNGTTIRAVHARATKPITTMASNAVVAAIGADRKISNWYRNGSGSAGRVDTVTKGTDMEIRFIPAAMFSVVEYGNKWGGGPKGKKPVQDTYERCEDIWVEELVEYMYDRLT